MDDLFIYLAISGESHHELRQAKRERVTLVNLPEMVDFTISLAHLLHVLALNGAWDSRHEQQPTLHLVEVGVPQPLLLVRQCQEEVLRYDVLEADQLGVGVGAIVDQALPHLLVQMPAEVVRLHLPRHVMRVKMEATHNIAN